ncbi:MAG: choice-of-anchor J domain-containing protein, partial [Bacteroidales bacterium]|nr:choice-of-anchor J domain-containing protein [Bacteroidales bacterium]
SCLKPTAVTVSNVTAHTANIAWTNGGTETAWTIDYNGTEIAADSNPFILTGLDAATSYTVKVKANCTEESASDWSYTTSFTTECEANTTFPYVQDFEATTFPPICWFQTRLAGSATSTDYANGAWARYGYSNGSNTTAQAQLRDDRAGNLHQLITGAQEFTYAGGYILSVDVYRNTSSYATEGIRIYVNNEPTVNANATELAFISRNYTVASTVNSDIVGAETASGWYTYELPITATGVNYIIFQGESQYGSSTYMDNVIIDETPTCPKPTAVTVSNITETTADIAWTENGTATEWTIEYNGTEITADSIPFTLTNLTNSTLYTVKVKANCSDDDESDWSTEVSFRTECGTIVVTDENPFLEGFEGSDFGCWTTEQVAGTANWELSTSYASEGNKSAKFPWTTNAEGRLIPPSIDWTQLTNSFVKFGHYQPAFSGAADELHLYYRASASDDWTLLQSFTTPTTGFAEEEIALPNPSATYQICFHGKGLDKLAIYVDNVFVGAYIPCLTPTAVVVSNETETSADVDWTAGNQETAWNIRYRPVSNSVFCDFEDGMQGWTTLNTDGDEYVFVHSSENIGEYDYTSFGHNGSNGFAVSNSYIDYVGEVNANQYLVAPNAITADSVTSLNFYYDFGNDTYPDYFEAGIFTQDPTDTTNFTSLWNSQDRGAANTNRSTVRHTEPTRYNNWREVTIDLSEYAGQQVWIAFHHQDYDNYELWLDDITIGELPSEWTVVEGVTNPYTIEGLTANTTYEVQVQAACSEDETSDWTASVEFTTLAADTTVEEPCATPANIAVENNVVTWESEAANFSIMIVANGDTTNATAAGNTYTVEGLENGTEVVVLVQAICDEDNLSDWTEGFTFTYETTGINNYSINVKVYPNPTTGLINVDCAAINADVTVYDMFGKLMMTSKIANERTELDFSAFAPGMYIVRIADANNSTNVKVVKK